MLWEIPMTTAMLRRGDRILVCDGKTALFLKIGGTAEHHVFEVEHSNHQELPSHNADMGSDKPGRVGQSGRRSAVEGSDWHGEQEKAFITESTRAFTAHVAPFSEAQLVIVAPPRALAIIRETADRALLSRCVAQIDKDLTRHSVPDIQKIILGTELKGS
jgi:protein required for attachment to host cells